MFLQRLGHSLTQTSYLQETGAPSSIPFIGDFSHESSLTATAFPRGKSGNAAAAVGDFAREPRRHRTCCGHRSGGSFTPLNTKTLVGTWTVGQPLSPFGIGSPFHSRLATCIGCCKRGECCVRPPACGQREAGYFPRLHGKQNR